MIRPESTRASGRSASPTCAAVAVRTARAVAAVRQSLLAMSSPPELFLMLGTTARAEAAGSSFLSVMLETRTAADIDSRPRRLHKPGLLASRASRDAMSITDDAWTAAQI